MGSTSGFFRDEAELAAILDGFSKARIAVVGDFFLDQYLVIDPALAELSVETGKTSHQIVGVRQSPGAAGTVMNNLVALDACQLVAVGVIGDDGPGYLLRCALELEGVDTTLLFTAGDRFTPTYTKPMFLTRDGETEGERLDIINRTPTPPEWEERILGAIVRVAGEVDAVILLDQVSGRDVGVLTHRVRENVGRIARRFSSTIFYADSRFHVADFRDVLLKPNETEALLAVGSKTTEPTEEQVVDAARTLHQRTGQPVFLTRGQKGILLVDAEGESLVPGFAVPGPVDICGAGDSATAGIVLALVSGASHRQAARVGNAVASRTVVQIGTTGTTTRAAIRETLTS